MGLQHILFSCMSSLSNPNLPSWRVFSIVEMSRLLPFFYFLKLMHALMVLKCGKKIYFLRNI